MLPVFVYGTLRTGGSNAHRMRGARSLGPATVKGRLYQVDPLYPGLIEAQRDEDLVHGELFEAVGPEHLAALDRYEGCGAQATPQGPLYRRAKTSVYRENHPPLSAWIWYYLRPVDPSDFITQGDWLRRKEPEK